MRLLGSGKRQIICDPHKIAWVALFMAYTLNQHKLRLMPTFTFAVAVVLVLVLSGLATAKVVEVTSSNVYSFIGGPGHGKKAKASTKVLNFQAPYCAHCRAFAPAYERMSDTLVGTAKAPIKVGTVDISVNQALVSWFKVHLHTSFSSPSSPLHACFSRVTLLSSSLCMSTYP